MTTIQTGRARIIANLDIGAKRATALSAFDDTTLERWFVLFAALMGGINMNVISRNDLPALPARGADRVSKQAFLTELNSLLSDRGLLPV